MWKTRIFETTVIYIGGHPIEKESYVKVTLTNLEIYHNYGDFIPDPYVLPESILKLIKKDLNDKQDDDEQLYL